MEVLSVITEMQQALGGALNLRTPYSYAAGTV